MRSRRSRTQRGGLLATWAGVACLLPVVASVLAGCGQKGPLYLPERNGTVVTRPGASVPAPQGTQQPATQQSTTDPPAGQTKKNTSNDDTSKK